MMNLEAASSDPSDPSKKLMLQALKRVEVEIEIIKDILRAEIGYPEKVPDKPDKPSKPAKSKPVKPKSADQKFYAASLTTSELGPTPDFQTDDWPEAVDPKMIISSEGKAEKQFRAIQIVNLIKLSLVGKNVLDCGCGEGYNANEMANLATKVVAYDPKQDPHWAARSKDNLILTSNKESVAEHAKFDVIVLYDVIDHLTADNPSEFMQWLASMLSDDGVIFIRTHPWSGRTGGHLYEFVNKAFLHLALTADEIIKAGLKIKEPNLKIVRPIAAYEQWFEDAGLKIDDKRIKTAKVESFFSGPIMDRIIKINWDGKIEADMARRIMTNQFIDYYLSKA